MWPTSTELKAAALALAAALAAGCSAGGARPQAEGAAAVADAATMARYQAALTTWQAGDEAAAERELEALAAAHPDQAGPLVNLGLIHAGRGEFAPAAALLEQATAVCTRCAPAWNALGVTQRQLGRFADAEQSYLKAIAADDGYAPARFNLAVLYELYLQRPELALDEYQRFRERSAGDPALGEVDKWIADLQRRTGAVQRSAQLEPMP